MSTENLIGIDQICTGYGIEYKFIDSLSEHGLIHLVTIADDRYLERDHLNDLEKMMRMHFELGLNIEGIEVALNLLDRISEMEKELKALRNKAYF